jgi:hypothetical protein
MLRKLGESYQAFAIRAATETLQKNFFAFVTFLSYIVFNTGVPHAVKFGMREE